MRPKVRAEVRARRSPSMVAALMSTPVTSACPPPSARVHARRSARWRWRFGMEVERWSDGERERERERGRRQGEMKRERERRRDGERERERQVSNCWPPQEKLRVTRRLRVTRGSAPRHVLSTEAAAAQRGVRAPAAG
eukprot:1732560-Rhodomonas_salina.1